MSKYEFTEDMASITGMPAKYEDAVRQMTVAGLEWLDAHPVAKPAFQEIPQVHGIWKCENADAKKLERAIGETVPGCSGGMVHFAIQQVMRISRMGWPEYQVKSRQLAADARAEQAARGERFTVERLMAYLRDQPPDAEVVPVVFYGPGSPTGRPYSFDPACFRRMHRPPNEAVWLTFDVLDARLLDEPEGRRVDPEVESTLYPTLKGPLKGVAIDAHRLLHELWTADVGREGYSKARWRALEGAIGRLVDLAKLAQRGAKPGEVP